MSPLDPVRSTGVPGDRPAPQASAGIDRGMAAVLAVTTGALAIAYWDVLRKLVLDWAQDDNYSHGFLIVPLAIYLAWERREQLARTPVRPSWLGLLVIAGGLVTLAAGTLGVELFLSRISLIAVVAGAIVFLAGWSHLRLLAFPMAVLVLMIPIPALVFNKIALPLQFIASQFGETVLRALHIPVLRQGNIIVLANGALEVAEACSGIRSLMSLFTLSLVYAYFAERRRAVQLLLLLSTVPIVIFTNGMRVALLGVASARYGQQVAEGLFHTFSGWVLFAMALACLFLLHRITCWRMPAAAAWPAARTSGGV